MSPPPVYALASNLINQTLNSIFLLESLSLITPADAHAIRSKLPPPSGPFPSLDPPAPYSPPPPQLHQSFSNLRVGQSASYSSQSPNDNAQPPTQSGIPALPQRMPPQQEQRARALWDYSGTVCLMNLGKYQTKHLQERDDLAFRAGDTIIIDEQGQLNAIIVYQLIRSERSMVPRSGHTTRSRLPSPKFRLVPNKLCGEAVRRFP